MKKKSKFALYSEDYKTWLSELKDRVRRVQLKAATAVNRELLQFYWELGAEIVEKQKKTSWGQGFLNKLSRDLMAEFPDMKGFSLSNIKYIRQWYLFYADARSIGQQAVGQIAKQAVSQITRIPWGHTLKDPYVFEMISTPIQNFPLPTPRWPSQNPPKRRVCSLTI